MALKTVILHVGHGKTGSSFLQSCLALSRKKLSDFDIDYPFHRSFSQAAAGRVSNGNGADFLAAVQDLGGVSSKILFSHENLFHTLIGKDSVAFSEVLQSPDLRFEVIIYARNLFEHSFSRWGQLVRNCKTNEDLDSFLMRSPLGPHPKILNWMQLSSRFGFKLKVTNYSRHKTNLARRFFYDLTGVPDFPFEAPSCRAVNRSLTYAEINFQRVCNSLKLNMPPLHRLLIEQLPNVRSTGYKCSRQAYDYVREKNLEIFRLINDKLPAEESLEIESSEDVTVEGDGLEGIAISCEQLDLITRYFARCLEDR